MRIFRSRFLHKANQSGYVPKYSSDKQCKSKVKRKQAEVSHMVELKVPKRENFSLAFFAQSEPTWVCDLGSGEKNRIFYQMTPVFDGFCFLPHTECAVNQKKI